MRPAGGARRVLIRLEGSFWMMRLNWAWAPLMIAPGWLAAADPPGTVGLIAIMVTAALSRAGVNVINDVVDSEKDRVTAPELPIPSGAVSVWQGLATFAAIAATMMVTVAIASATFLAYVGCIVALGAGAVATVVYSFAKRHWLLAPVVASAVYVCLPFAAWLAAGAGGVTPIALVLGYQLLYGIAGNIQAAVRDVDSDAEVGNISIAVRLGAGRALRAAACFDVAAHAMILAVGLSIGRAAVTVPLLAISLALVVSAYGEVLGRQQRTAGRVERMVAGRRLGLSRQAEPLALVATFSIPVAVGTLAASALLLYFLIPGYTRRIVDGGLARELELARLG